MDREQVVEAAVCHFISQTEIHDSLACYGKTQTRAALKLGAVHLLLVAAAPTGAGRCRKQVWSEMAAASGAALVEVFPQSALSVQFCEGFGVGAILRYPIDPALLEEEEEEPVSLASPAETQP